MRVLNTKTESFDKQWQRFLREVAEVEPAVERSVDEILAAVRQQGDKALFRFTRLLDRFPVKSGNIRITLAQRRQALEKVPQAHIRILKRAAERIRRFHQKQRLQGNSTRTEVGQMGLRWLPLDKVGIYVPGGKAAYPSTVLMNAIPAQVAGVSQIVMVTPSPNGILNPYTIAAASIVGVKEIYRIGGAQAIAALAFGTETVPAVDKIVGPGNIYVAIAKRKVFGQVAIDMIAGPSEVLVIADGSADPDFVASDLLSQSEHDPDARPALISTSTSLIERTLGSLKRQLTSTPRRKMATEAIRRNGVAIQVKGRAEAVRLANEMAPEHLVLMVRDKKSWLGQIRNAGAIFIGNYSPVASGDYLAGPNHVLPTGRSARYASPLGVYDFLKASSWLELTRKGLAQLAGDIVQLAELEGLTAHGDSVKIRLR